MTVRYIQSEHMCVQGSMSSVLERFGSEWHIKEMGKGNGNWLLTKKSDAVIDGKSYRRFILDFYDKTRLTKNLVKRFEDDLSSGVVQLYQ